MDDSSMMSEKDLLARVGNNEARVMVEESVLERGMIEERRIWGSG